MHTDSRVISFVCSALYEVDVYVRLKPALQSKGWKVVAVTHLFSAWLRARRAGIDCSLIAAPRGAACPEHSTQTPEERLGLVTPAQAQAFREAFWEMLERHKARFNPSVLVQWSGLSLGGRVATIFARRNGLKTLYLELGNIEPKMFADTQGVNAAASLARDPGVLDKYSVTDAEIDRWKGELIARRKSLTSLPQARRLLHLNPWFVVDKLAAAIRNAPMPRRQSAISRLAEKIRLARTKRPPPAKPERPYIFLPLQVSKDSNLLLFADYDNLSALALAARQAREAGLLLVVKPHPAETDAGLMAEIRGICDSDGHLLTTFNTTELVLGATAVITINSTVGMEAKLLGKPVKILGRSLYGLMSPRQIAALAMRRLIDFSPFGQDIASDAAACQLLALLDEPVVANAQSASALTGEAK